MCFVLELAMHDFAVIANNSILLWLPMIFSGALVMLACRYWFIYPLIGTAMGLVSFVVGVSLTV